jgi:hypothetical protein
MSWANARWAIVGAVALALVVQVIDVLGLESLLVIWGVAIGSLATLVLSGSSQGLRAAGIGVVPGGIAAVALVLPYEVSVPTLFLLAAVGCTVAAAVFASLEIAGGVDEPRKRLWAGSGALAASIALAITVEAEHGWLSPGGLAAAWVVSTVVVVATAAAILTRGDWIERVLGVLPPEWRRRVSAAGVALRRSERMVVNDVLMHRGQTSALIILLAAATYIWVGQILPDPFAIGATVLWPIAPSMIVGAIGWCVVRASER